MSVVSNSKRVLDANIGDSESSSSAASRKKVGRKLLNDSDVKSKRTFQNRNAQRAFRERKERKLKELEDKVLALEQVNEAKELETNFLRSRLKSMADELKKYRPAQSSDLEVLEYLAKKEQLAKYNHNANPIKEEEEVKEEEEDEEGEEGGDNIHANQSFEQESAKQKQEILSNIEKKKDFTFEYPKQNKMPSPESSTSITSSVVTSGKYNVQLQQGSVNNQVTTPDSSVSSSTWIHPVFYEDNAKQLPQFEQPKAVPTNMDVSPANSDINQSTSDIVPGSAKSFDAIPFGYDSSLFSNDFNFDDKFSDQVSSFCDKVNNPNYSPENNSLPSLVSENYNAESHNNTIALPDTTTEFGKKGFEFANSDATDTFSWNSGAFHEDDPSSKLFIDTLDKQYAVPTSDASIANDFSKANNFIESSLAFPESTASVANSMNGNLYFRDSNIDNTIDMLDLLADDDDDEDEVDESLIKNNLVTEECMDDAQAKSQLCDKYKNTVIRAEDGSYLKCSQVWSRLTEHPKYSELDIDGLCTELMLQAKCSEKGVVVESRDVQKALSKYLSS
ncbi:hypothetical protein TPHA_0K00520 [Tetrapisispora phaffii CBS 4417]|uniref:BZIP domain-containing protein n=1 Tax=Tetrapisispora phaffii (strain ATCC 24235 / CBS 4417 / NBRC 1672 / NRRL Y-8282 / UCD 70-5) TaxID=1071381 RepID=G8BZ58_TETPH|nr:hypothetical protein TPHA_0K00520 [Tetrapisispora phaffii CBS 4417]CCE65186.1 hypothetical protein TPHA_0K00520 [Tetrapisispora phaffii CBS 4417]